MLAWWGREQLASQLSSTQFSFGRFRIIDKGVGGLQEARLGINLGIA